MANGDWIKLHRKLLDSPIMRHAGLCQLWVYCLAKANWKDGKWLVPGTLAEVMVPRGSFITGRSSLHSALYPECDLDGKAIEREWTPHPQTVWRWLSALGRMNCVNLKTLHSRATLVSVCNYSTYQDVESGNVQVMHKSCTGDAQVMHTIEESKNTRREEEEKKSASTGTQNSNPSDDRVSVVTGRRADPKEFLRLWNEHVPFSRTEVLGPTCERNFRLLVQSDEWSSNYLEALKRVKLSPFLRGETDEKFTITPTFFLRENTVALILQGFYAERGCKANKPSVMDSINRTAAEFLNGGHRPSLSPIGDVA